MKLEPFKYVGDEKSVSIFETTSKKCSSCGLSVPSEDRVEKVTVTYYEVTNVSKSKWRFFATLNGHKIMDRILEEPCRWEIQ